GHVAGNRPAPRVRAVGPGRDHDLPGHPLQRRQEDRRAPLPDLGLYPARGARPESEGAEGAGVVESALSMARKPDSAKPSAYDPGAALEFFKSAGKVQDAAKGTTIFTENRKGMPLLLMPNRIYLLVDGDVGVFVKDRHIASIRAGEVFGEMAAMGGMPRSG